MLSVQKQQMPKDAAPESSSPPSATGFARVLNSIQGLQQRLDDFSVEEVSRAHAKTHALIFEINSLQAQLDALAKLKAAVSSASAQIAAIPEANFDLVGPDSLEKHPQLRALIQAGKLIRMHRVLRAAQASAETSFDLEASIPNNDAPSIPTQAAYRASSPTPEQIPEAPSLETRLAASTGEHEIAAEPDQPPAEVGNSPVAHGAHATTTYDFAGLKLEEPQETTSPRESESSKAAPKNQDAASSARKKNKGKPQINKRLLSDLIETYGEFAISAKPSGQAVIEMPPPAAEQIASTSTDLVPFQATPGEASSVSPIEGSEPLGPPALEQERVEPIFDEPSPSLKSRGEIDRQLKNIIKDYGEVDLYSHGKPLKVSVKTAVIAAVAGLAVVIGGFFLFKAPPASTPAAVEVTTPEKNGAAEISERPQRPSNAKRHSK